MLARYLPTRYSRPMDAARRRQLKDANNLGRVSDLDREIEDCARCHRLRGPMPSLGLALALAGACATVDRVRLADAAVWFEWIVRGQVPSTDALCSIGRQVLIPAAELAAYSSIPY